MNKKQLYTAPEADLLVVRFEENIMSAKVKSLNHTLYFLSGDDDDYEEDWDEKTSYSTRDEDDDED